MKAKRRAKATVKQRVQLLTVVAVLAATFAGIGAVSFLQPKADAADATAAAAPVEIWSESFENGVGATPTSVVDYRSASGAAYSADAFWLNTANCNGVVTNYNANLPVSSASGNFPTGLCSNSNASQSQMNVRRLADVLGQVAAGAPGAASEGTATTSTSTASTKANHAVTGWTTSVAGGSNLVLLQSAATGYAAAGTRYYTATIDVAEASCAYASGANNSRLDLFATVDGTERKVTASPIRACSNSNYYASAVPPTSSNVTISNPWGSGGIAVRAGRFSADGSLQLTAAQVAAARFVVRNQTGATEGNDIAVDNLRLVDATPALDLSFDQASTTSGTPTTLTFTITNTSELAAKTDWGFTNTLPSGLVVAQAPNITSTCSNTTGTAYSTTATAGTGTVRITGADFAAGAAQCTVSVDVVAAAPGTYTDGPANIVNSSLLAPQSTTLAVDAPTTLTIQKNIVARSASGDQFTLSLRNGSALVSTATTSGSATGIQTAKVKSEVQPGGTYTIAESPTSGAGLSYGSSYECVRDDTVIAAGDGTSASITVPDEKGVDIVCTFTNTPRTATLLCDSNHFYSVAANGNFVQADAVTGTTTTLYAGASNISGVNALGIAANGSAAYGLIRTSDTTDVSGIFKYSPASGASVLNGTAFQTRDGSGTEIAGSLVAGAVDLSSGRYVFGKYNGSRFYVWSYTESSNSFAYLGYIATGTAPVGNGDMAFDANGNLYVVGSQSGSSGNQVAIFSVTAANFAGANGGAMTASISNTATLSGFDSGSSLNEVNGIAFSPRGTVYLGNASSLYEFDATTWKRIASSPRIASNDSVDLASCASPSTITVQKNIVGRVASGDQFTLSLANGTSVTSMATTSGSTTGRQASQVGPYPAVVGSTLTISEVKAAGTGALASYTAVYECWAGGVRIAAGAATSGSVTMPNSLGVGVTCTFFNSPKPATTVKVSKLVVDPATGATSPRAGWTVGATSTGTTGSTTVLPADQTQQQTGADGSASWTVLYSSTGSAAATVTVSEVQQAGFQFVGLACTVNGASRTATTTTAGSTISASIANVASSSTIDCAFTNRPVATLTIVDKVGFGSASAEAWTISATGPSTAITGPSGKTGTAATTARTISAGVPYRLAQTGGTVSYVQVGSWSCVDGAGKPVAVSADGDATIAPGSSVTCTVTNSTAGLTILKNVIDPQTGFEAKNWTITATPNAFTGLSAQSKVGAEYSSAANGNAASTIEVRPGHGYTLTEALTDQTSKVAYQELRLEQLVNGNWVTVNSASITAPAAGQSAVYRFVNAPIPGVVLPLTGGMSTDAFMIAGALILLLALSVAVLHGSRRRRRSTA